MQPLTINELQEATTIIPYGQDHTLIVETNGQCDISGLLKSLYPLIYVANETVHLMHATFRNYVLPAGSSEPLHDIVEKLGTLDFQSELASQCLVYLSRPHFKDFIMLSSKSDAMKGFAIFQYAAANWVSHTLNDPNVNMTLKEQLHSFLSKNQAITWLEQYMEHKRGDIVTLQTQLYHHRGYAVDPKWLLNVLIDSVEERKERDPDSVITSSLTIELGTLYRYHGLAKDAAAIHEQIYRKQKVSIDPDARRLRHALNNLALVKSDLNELNEAKQLFEELLGIIKTSAVGNTDEDFMITLGNLASVYSRQGQYSKAVELSAERLALSRAFHGDHHVNTCMAYNNFAHACLAIGKAEIAKENILKAYQLYTEIQGKDSHGALLALHNLASAESALDNDTEALRLSKYVWTTRQERLGEDHPDTLIACNNYIANLHRSDRVKETLPLLENQVRIQQKLRGPSHPASLLAQANLAKALERLGRYAEALELERDTLYARKQSLGISHPDTLLSMSNYANTLRAAQKFQEARPLLVDCLRLCSEILGLYHERTISAMRSLSGLCQEMNCYHLAEYLATRGLHLTQVTHSADHRSTLLSEVSRGTAMKNIGKYDAAGAIFRRIVRIARRGSIEDADIVLSSKIALSSTHRFQGDYEAALGVADQVVDQCETRGKDTRRWLLAAWEQQGLALGKLERHQEALNQLQKVHEERIKYFGSESYVKLLS